MNEPMIVLSIPVAISIGGILVVVVTSHVRMEIGLRQTTKDVSQIRKALGLELANGQPQEPIFLRRGEAVELLKDAEQTHEEIKDEIAKLRDRAHTHGNHLTRHDALLDEHGRKIERLERP